MVTLSHAVYFSLFCVLSLIYAVHVALYAVKNEVRAVRFLLFEAIFEASGTFTLVSTENPMMSKFSDDIPTIPHENLMSQSSSNVVAIFPPKTKKMESIF